MILYPNLSQWNTCCITLLGINGFISSIKHLFCLAVYIQKVFLFIKFGKFFMENKNFSFACFLSKYYGYEQNSQKLLSTDLKCQSQPQKSITVPEVLRIRLFNGCLKSSHQKILQLVQYSNRPYLYFKDISCTNVRNAQKMQSLGFLFSTIVMKAGYYRT